MRKIRPLYSMYYECNFYNSSRRDASPKYFGMGGTGLTIRVSLDFLHGHVDQYDHSNKFHNECCKRILHGFYINHN